MTISILRADVENEISAIAFISKIAASFGSEWRDGTFFHERLTVADISFVKENFKYNFLTFIPGWSFFAPLSAQELINAQMVSILSEILGLRDLGVSGIRIGMIWEAYILFGYFGVVTIAIFSAILTRISHLLIFKGASASSNFNFIKHISLNWIPALYYKQFWAVDSFLPSIEVAG